MPFDLVPQSSGMIMHNRRIERVLLVVAMLALATLFLFGVVPPLAQQITHRVAVGWYAGYWEARVRQDQLVARAGEARKRCLNRPLSPFC
jgi:hypothetical protein